MLKLLLGFCLFGLIQNSSFGQSPLNEEYNFWSVNPDSSAVVYAQKVYVRQSAGIKFPIVDSLTTGAPIKIIETTKSFHTARNIHAPWVKVSYKRGPVLTEGYVWLGAISIGYRVAGNIKFLYGVETAVKKKDPDAYIREHYVIKLKVLSNDSLIDLKEWKVEGGEFASYTSMLLLGNPGLANLQNVVRIQFGGEACGIPTTYYYYGYNGKKLVSLPGKYTVGDAGVFYHSEILLFPNEQGGQPGKIIRLIEEEEVLEEETATKKEKVKHSNSREIYNWDGEKAIQIKKSR